MRAWGRHGRNFEGNLAEAVWNEKVARSTKGAQPQEDVGLPTPKNQDPSLSCNTYVTLFFSWWGGVKNPLSTQPATLLSPGPLLIFFNL